ncbi:unnamed protein product [Echinostoma caproni]|uniref:Telo_bind domain-containing protein n=1 Tax=Echinostoma caproni TaxID=27848 RepID=A0A183AG07_9TREM|nr:unnamed protein product [Echinostoma caproni]
MSKSRVDRYFILTLDSECEYVKVSCFCTPTYGMRLLQLAGWKQNVDLQFLHVALNSIKPCGCVSLGEGLQRVFKMLNLNRLQLGLENYGMCQPAVVVDFNHENESSTEKGDGCLPSYSQKQLVYVKILGRVCSTWPIPESYWPDDEILSSQLPSRSAHPKVYISSVQFPAPNIPEYFPLDRYELEPSPLTRRLCTKDPNMVWQCYCVDANRGRGAPFAYLKATGDSQTVHLHVLPYNYPNFAKLLKIRSKTDKLTSRSSVLPYCRASDIRRGELRRVLKKMRHTLNDVLNGVGLNSRNDFTHQQPVNQMGDYINYKGCRTSESPLREVNPAPERLDTFGNPFRKKNAAYFVADEVFVDEMGISPGVPGGPNVSLVPPSRRKQTPNPQGPVVRTKDGSHIFHRLNELSGSLGQRYAAVSFVMSEALSKACVVGHMDTPARALSFFHQTRAFFNQLNDRSCTDVFLLGGVNSEGIQDYRILFVTVGQLLHDPERNFVVKLFCVEKLNTVWLSCPRGPRRGVLLNYPASTGLVYNWRTRTATPATINWKARGPVPALRLARLRSPESFNSMVSVFDHSNCSLFVKPFESCVPYPGNPEELTEEVMRAQSTTPDLEPPAYFEGCRAVALLTTRYPRVSFWFPNNHPLLFSPRGHSDTDTDGVYWIPVDTASAFAHNHPLTAVTELTNND